MSWYDTSAGTVANTNSSAVRNATWAPPRLTRWIRKLPVPICEVPAPWARAKKGVAGGGGEPGSGVSVPKPSGGSSVSQQSGNGIAPPRKILPVPPVEQ